MNSSFAARHPATEIFEKVRTENGVIGGLALSKYYGGHDDDFLVCVTETNTKTADRRSLCRIAWLMIGIMNPEPLLFDADFVF